MRVVWCALCVARCGVCYALCVLWFVCCMLCVVCGALFVAYYMLYNALCVACSVACVICCAWCVVRCVFCVVVKLRNVVFVKTNRNSHVTPGGHGCGGGESREDHSKTQYIAEGNIHIVQRATTVGKSVEGM